MARLFDDGSTESLQYAGVVHSNLPMAVVCHFNTDDMEVSQCLFSVCDIDVDNQRRLLYLDTVGDIVSAYEGSPTQSGQAVTSTSYSVDTWHHAGAIWVATNDRRVFIDGGSKGTNANATTLANLDTTAIGRFAQATPNEYMSGMIAEMAVYDLSVWPGATASDKADAFEKILPSLAKGFSPLFWPLGLVAHWPLVRGLKDKIGGYDMTADGTAVAAHSRIILPYGRN